MDFTNMPQEIFKNISNKNENKKDNYESDKHSAIKFLQENGLNIDEENLEIFFCNSYIQKVKSFFKCEHIPQFSNGSTIIPKYHKNQLVDCLSDSEKHFIIINTEILENLKNKNFFTSIIVHELVHHIDFCYYDINERKFKADNYLFMLFSEYRAKYYQELFLIENNQAFTSHSPIEDTKQLLLQEKNIDKNANNILYNTFHGIGYIVAYNQMPSCKLSINDLKEEHKNNILSLKKLEKPDKIGDLDNLINFLTELINKNEIQDIPFLEEFISKN